MFSAQYDSASFAGRPRWVSYFLPTWKSRRQVYGTFVLLATAAVSFAISVMRRKKMLLSNSDSSDAEREALLLILHEVSRRLFHVARHVTCIAQTVRQQLHARQQEEGISALDDDWLTKEISQQCQIEEKVQAIEHEVLLSKAYSEIDFAQARQRFQEHPDVKTHVEETQQMFSDALCGMEPVLPRVHMPKSFTDEVLLELHREVQHKEVMEVRDFVRNHAAGIGLAPAEVQQVVALCAKKAERDTFEEHQDLLGKDGEIYFSARALRSRSPGFAARLAACDQNHKRAMIAAFCN